LEHPLELVKDVVYPVVSQKTLQDVVKEYKSTGPTYRAKVYTVMRASYLHHYRRMVPQLLDTLEFRSTNDMHRPVISALELLKKYKGSTQHYYSPEDKIFINGVLKSGSHDLIVEVDKIHKEHLRNAIATIVNEIFRVRMTHIWGEGTTAWLTAVDRLPTINARYSSPPD